MTLSEKDLEYFRELFDWRAYNFLLPLLRCEDITWNESTKNLSISGETFATVYSRHENDYPEIFVAKKFWRNSGVVEVDNRGITIGITIGVKKRNTVTIWHHGGWRSATVIGIYVYFQAGSWVVSDSFSRKNNHILNFYNERVLCVL